MPCEPDISRGREASCVHSIRRFNASGPANPRELPEGHINSVLTHLGAQEKSSSSTALGREFGQ